MRLLLLATLAALASAGCRTACKADERASKEQLEREQKAVLRGQGIRLELLRPSLALVDDELVVTASGPRTIARRAELPADVPLRFTPLHDRLAGYREHFRAVRGADLFDPTLEVKLDPRLETARAVTVLATAAHAGYPRARVHAGALDVVLEWFTGIADGAALCVTPRAGGAEIRVGSARRDAADLAGVAGAVDAVCAGRSPCAEIVRIDEGDATVAKDLLGVAAAALGAAAFRPRAPRIVIVARVPATGFARAAPGCDP